MRGDPDIVVIGSGMGGAALARGLAGSGARVLILERGRHLPREPQNWDVAEVFANTRYKAHDAWLDANGRTFNPGIHYVVGGNTKVYGAAMLRLRERDFEALEHEEGTSPAWPVDYATMEPWYARAEAMLGVHGAAGTDPTDPPRSGPYPHLPIAHDPPIARLVERLREQGLRPFPLPAAIDQGPGGACVRCATCDGFPCPLGAKGDAETRCLEPALRDPAVELRTESFVERLLTTPDGRRADGIELVERGERRIQRAGTVVVACGAVNSAALLLRSAGGAHQGGLANRSGQVGRNYMVHNATAVMGVRPLRADPAVYQKSFAVNDFYFGAPDDPWPLGNLQMLGKLQAGMLAAARPGVPRPIMAAIARRSVDWYVMSEDLPHPDNRVSLAGDGRIRLAWTPRNLAPHRRLVARLRSILRRAGWPIALSQPFGIETTSHQCGTVCFGDDPATSVLDPLCRAWDVDNLYVVDGSFMPSSAAVNPALTIAAQALRVAAHLRGQRDGTGRVASR